MAEKIKIVDLDLNTDLVMHKAVKVKEQINEISKEIKFLKDSQKEAQANIEKYTEELETMKQTGSGTANQMKVLSDDIRRQKEILTELTAEEVVQESHLKKMQSEYRVYNTILTAKTESGLKEMQMITETNGSIKELSSALSHNKQLYQELSQSERENEEIGGKLLKVIQEQDKKYKDLQKSIGNNQVEVGNYKEEIKKALQETFSYNDALQNLASKFGAFGGVVLSVEKSLRDFINGKKQSKESVKEETQAVEENTAIMEVNKAVQMANAEAVAGTTAMIVTQEEATKKLSVMQKMAEIRTKGLALGFKILRIAFASTVIGAVIVLLGSLVAYFTTTQEGINKVNRVLAPFKEVWQSLIGVLQDLGKAFLPLISSLKSVGELVYKSIILPFNQAKSTFKALGQVLKGNVKQAWEELKKPAKEMYDVSSKALKDVTKGSEQMGAVFGGLSKRMKEAYKRGGEIQKLQDKLRTQKITDSALEGKLTEEYKAQNKIAEDTTKSFEERRKAAQRTIDIQNKLMEMTKNRANIELKILDLQTQANDTSDADKQVIADKKRQIGQEVASRLEAITTQNNKLNQINKSEKDKQLAQDKEYAQKRKDQLQEQLKEESELIEEYLRGGSAMAKSLGERLSLEEKAKNDRLSVLEKEKKAGLKTQNEYNRERKEIEMAYITTRADLIIQNANKELETYIKTNSSKLNDAKRLTADLVEEEKNRLTSIYKKQVEALDKEKSLKIEAKSWDYIQEEEYQQKKKDLEEQTQKEKNDIQKKWDTQIKDEAKIMRELEGVERIELMKQEGATEFEIRQEQLTQKYEKEKEKLNEQLANDEISHDEYLKRISILENQHAEEQKDINKAVAEAKLSLVQDTISKMVNLLGQESDAGKALAIADTTISTYKAAQKAYESTMHIPIIGPYLAPIQAGIAVASGLKNVQKIMAVKNESKKFEFGGFVAKGKSHAQGGIPFSVGGEIGYEMEGGEFISSKKATKMFLPFLHLFNDIANNGKGQNNGVYFENGGLVRQSIIKENMGRFDVGALSEAVRLGALEGSRVGSEQGAYSGSQQGAYSGALQGSRSGTMAGMETAQINSEIMRLSSQ